MRVRFSAAGVLFLLCPALVLGCTFVCSPPAEAHESIDRQIEQLTSKLSADPEAAALYLRRGELHRIHRDWEKAKADYLKARSLDPALAAVDLCLGELYLDSDEPRKAVKSLDRFLKKNPDHFRGLLTRARALAADGKPMRAVTDYDRAVSIDVPSPTLPEAYLERARLLVDQGESSYKRAVEGLDHGLQRLGEPVTLQLLAIDLEQRQGRWDAAIARVDRIAAQSQRKESWWIRRGEIQQSAGRADDALISYRMALESIQLLPENRRKNRAVRKLESAALDGIAALEER